MHSGNSYKVYYKSKFHSISNERLQLRELQLSPVIARQKLFPISLFSASFTYIWRNLIKESDETENRTPACWQRQQLWFQQNQFKTDTASTRNLYLKLIIGYIKLLSNNLEIKIRKTIILQLWNMVIKHGLLYSY